MRRRVEFTEIIDHMSFYIDDESQEITVKCDSGYKTLVELANDYGISVDGNILINYNGKIFIGSMTLGESIGMTLDEISNECQRRYEQRMKEISVEYGLVYTEYDINDPTSIPCNTCVGCNI